MKQSHRIIWAFGFGYLFFYAPYSALIKAITSGFVPGVPAGLSGYELLPATIAGTLLSVVLALTLLGWWQHLRGITLTVVLSGFGTALIIGCTTLAYTFKGVSIVLALLLMRGGVLVAAPFIDLFFRRRVRWFSWTALAISFGAIALSLGSVRDYDFTLAAAVNLALYLSGYLIRLPCMTRCAKVDDVVHTRRYLVQEGVVACVFLAAIPAALAMIGSGPVMLGLRRGFTMHSVALVPALMIGVLYSCLYLFGTLIYLDRRENTFCIPLNRCCSLLAGVVAAYALTGIFHIAPPPLSQITSAILIVLALLLLSPLHHLVEDAWSFVRHRGPELKGAMLAPSFSPRRILFVCSGNTCRSPMAAAIANAEIALRLGLPIDDVAHSEAYADSAGVAARTGESMTPESHTALAGLAVRVARPHLARSLTPELVESADAIYTMTRALRDALQRDFPAAASKTRCLDPDGDVPDPIGKSAEVYADTAKRLLELVRMRFDEAGAFPLFTSRLADPSTV